MNKLKLKAFMILNKDTLSTLSKHLSITPQRLSAKINEYRGAEFTQGEIAKIKELYKLSPNEVEEIFFNQ